jgi:hypothetical protein
MESNYSDDIRDWLDRGDWSNWFAVTVTMRRSFVSDTGERSFITVERASQNLRHFLNRMNKAIFGNAYKRYGKRVQVIPVYEKDVDTHLHFHLFIEKPDRLSDLRFECLIRTNWIKSDWGLWSIDIQKDTDSGWLKYITKDTCASFENVDFENLWITD